MHQCRGQLSRNLLSYLPRNYELEKHLYSIAGGKRGRFCRCSVCAVCCVCSVLRRLARWCEMTQKVSKATQSRYVIAIFHSNQSEIFPLSAGVSGPYLPSAPNKATETVIFCFGKNVCTSGSNSRRKQRQQQEEAAAAPRGSSSSRRK